MKKKEKKSLSYIKNRRDKLIKFTKLSICIILTILCISYFILKIIYETGSFTITLDESFSKKSGLIMYERAREKTEKKILKVDKMEFLDNISINWLPSNINNEKDGSHNGEYYIAYTFYLENQGVENINYWYTTIIDDVIKDVDEAIRVMIYLNGNKTVYAKVNQKTLQNEVGTKAFYSENCVEAEQRVNMKPGEIDKITFVIWIEGDDPQCLDNLIGGEMKMHMEITEEFLDNK